MEKKREANKREREREREERHVGGERERGWSDFLGEKKVVFGVASL